MMESCALEGTTMSDEAGGGPRSDYPAGGTRQRVVGSAGHGGFLRFAGLALAILVLYHANFDDINQVDTVPGPYIAWSLLEEGNFDLDESIFRLRRHCSLGMRYGSSGHWVSRYPPGNGLMAVPVYALYRPFAGGFPGEDTMMRLGKFTGALYCALAAAVFFQIASSLFRRSRVLGTVLFAFGTTVWSTASQSLWGHGPAVFWVCVAMFLLMVPKGRLHLRGLLAGGAFGMAIFCRPTVGVLLVGIAGWLLVSREYRLALGLCAGAAGPILALMAYNGYYAGSSLSGGYAEGATMSAWSTPLWIGLLGLTVSPSRGLLFFTPAVVVSVYGASRLIRNRTELCDANRRVLIGAMLGAVGTVILFAKWHAWWGGWSYGPRYLTEIMPIVCLLFCLGYLGLSSVWSRRTAVGLVILSVGIHFVGVVGYEDGWNARHFRTAHAIDVFDPTDPQILASLKELASHFVPEGETDDQPIGAPAGAAGSKGLTPEHSEPAGTPASPGHAASVPAPRLSGAASEVGGPIPEWAKVSPQQAEAARSAGLPVWKEVALGPHVTLRLVYVPSGSFLLGSPPSEPKRQSDEMQHRFTVAKGFFIGIHEVTQEQWEALMGGNPSRFGGDGLPVDSVSWHDCQAFISALNRLTHARFRLPTEAEWEYACRSGTVTPFHFGATISPDQANYMATKSYSGGPKGEYRQRTTPVGSFSPNGFGLYDVHGNVWEWCQSLYAPYPYDPEDGREELGPSGPRVLRGGAWYGRPERLRSAVRLQFPAASPHGLDGFRVVLEP